MSYVFSNMVLSIVDSDTDCIDIPDCLVHRYNQTKDYFVRMSHYFRSMPKWSILHFLCSRQLEEPFYTVWYYVSYAYYIIFEPDLFLTGQWPWAWVTMTWSTFKWQSFISLKGFYGCQRILFRSFWN